MISFSSQHLQGADNNDSESPTGFFLDRVDVDMPPHLLLNDALGGDFCLGAIKSRSPTAQKYPSYSYPTGPARGTQAIIQSARAKLS